MFQAGIAKRKITPGIGIQMIGQPMTIYSKSVLDDLFVRALLLSDGNTSSILASVDILMLAQSTMDSIKEKVHKKSGFKKENIFITATHTHSGPHCIPLYGVECDDGYLPWLEEQVSACILEAIENVKPCKLFASQVRVDDLAFCERVVMRGGRVETHPNKHDPDIVCSESVTDSQVGLFSVQSPEGKVLAIYLNYACHAQAMERVNSAISADFPAQVELFLQQFYGNDLVMLFGPGACGDICPVNPMDVAAKEVGRSWCCHMGRVLGQAVLQASWKELCGNVSVLTDIITLTRRQVTKEHLEKVYLESLQPEGEDLPISECGIEELEAPFLSLEQHLQTSKWKKQEYLDLLQLNKMNEQGREENIGLGLLSIGDWAMVTLPFEVFCEIGLKIKEISPYRNTFVVELTNGHGGYLPTEKAFSRPGSYETLTLRSSRFVPDSCNIVVEAVKKMFSKAT